MAGTVRAGGLADCTVLGLSMRDVRAAALFAEMGVNLCDEGTRSVRDVCAARGADLDAVTARLAALGMESEEDGALQSDEPWWALDRLSDLIIRRHHGYIRDALPALRAWLAQLVDRQTHRDAHLPELRAAFEEMAQALMSHLAKEEAILFPALVALAQAYRERAARPPLPFPTVLHPIRLMESEHKRLDDLIARIRQLTSDYTPPADGCATWRACYAELGRFDRELTVHTRFEHHLLFPRALEIEQHLV